MRFTKAKIVAAGMILAGICMIAPQQLRAEVPKTQMDGVMGQSIKEEMDDTQISDVEFAEGRIVVHICHATAAGGI